MAKKKSKNKGKKQQGFSPERYMREKARTLPIGKCYVSPPDWQEAGIVHVIITRVRPSGNLVMAAFLVDTFCLGIKDAGYHENITPDKFEENLNRYKRGMGVEEISYNEAHNLIYGAIEFAEEGGVHPVKEFNTAGYILDEDTDDIPLIEYEYGKNGKHFLIVSPDRKEIPYLNILKKNLGDNFDFVTPIGEDVDEEDDYDDEYDDSLFSDIGSADILRAMKNMEKMTKESARHPKEEYSYQHPDYPQEVRVKHQFIADELLSKDNYDFLSRKVIDRILALDPDEAAQDISNVVMYVIGRTYEAIDDDTIGSPTESAILHSLLLLANIKSDKGLDAILEIMRQNGNFADYHLGDLAPELIHPALYACGRNNLAAIEEYLYQPGLDSYLRTQAVDALAMVAINHPERRGEIIEVFRRLLNSMNDRLPRQEACDGEFAGFTVSALMDITAKELIPEIKAVFATGCVDKTIAGDCKKVIQEIESGKGTPFEYKYIIPNIYQEYDRLKQLLNDNK